MRLPQTAFIKTVSLSAALAVTLTLSACGGMRDSRLNPMNWFGKSRETTVAVAVAPTEDVDAKGRSLVQSVLTMAVEPYPGGAIVRATGLPPTQGWWEAELVAQPVDENGVLVLDFRVFPPITPWPAGTQPSREITAALALSDIKMTGVREIVVRGAGNARSSRR